VRACTAVVTEMSWNDSDDPFKKYRAEIEFINPKDWEKDLKASLDELTTESGSVKNLCLFLVDLRLTYAARERRGSRY
jgi:hypothetical protein